MRFWLQTQARNGEWVDNLGASDKQACADHAVFLMSKGASVRVVERVDTVVMAQCDLPKKVFSRPRG